MSTPNQILSVAAGELRIMMREIIECFISKDIAGWIGILFSPGNNKDFIAFAESISETQDLYQKKIEIETQKYILPADAHLFVDAFFNSSKDSSHGVYKINSAVVCHPKNKCLQLERFSILYPDIPTDFSFPMYWWKLTDNPKYKSAIYIYLYDVYDRLCETQQTMPAIHDTRFFISYMLRSLILDFQITHPNTIWDDIGHCFPKNFGFKHSIAAEQKRLENQKKASRVDAIKLTIGHYGHTLKHRLDTLNAFLDQPDTPPLIRMRQCMLRDLTLILQLSAIDDREQLLEKTFDNKVDRFLEIEGTKKVPASINLVDSIKKWSSSFISTENMVMVVDKKRNIHEERLCEKSLDITTETSKIVIGFPMVVKTKHGAKHARFKNAIYRELIFELLSNVMRYGAYKTKFNPNAIGEYNVNVSLMISHCQISMSEIKNKIDLLVLSNIVQPEKSKDVFIANTKQGTWHRWPEEKKYDGPGMAVELFRRLKAGDMFYCIEKINGQTVFRVGLNFEGMKIIP